MQTPPWPLVTLLLIGLPLSLRCQPLCLAVSALTISYLKPTAGCFPLFKMLL